MVTTRSATRRRPHSPGPPIGSRYAAIPTKQQLVGAARHVAKLKNLYESEGIKSRTARRWRRRYKQHGSPSLRRKHGSGRPFQISQQRLDLLFDPDQNQAYGLSYHEQILFDDLPLAQPRSLRRNVIERKHARRFKRAKVIFLPEKKKQARVEFAKQHENESVQDFWQFVHFTDEVHFDATEIPTDFVLREEGTRNQPENMQQMPSKEGISLHIAASISWWHKGKLQFYNDEKDQPANPTTIEPEYPSKPRRRPKTESEEDFQSRLTCWEANKPHSVDIKKKGNSMTMAYYCQRLLPDYMNSINQARIQGDWERPARAILQEDGDPSHGTVGKGDNMAKQARRANWIETYLHPARSLDLNPIEGIWLRLKVAVRKRCKEYWGDTEILKRVILRYGLDTKAYCRHALAL